MAISYASHSPEHGIRGFMMGAIPDRVAQATLLASSA
jgi:hypothetical protein